MVVRKSKQRRSRSSKRRHSRTKRVSKRKSKRVSKRKLRKRVSKKRSNKKIKRRTKRRSNKKQKGGETAFSEQTFTKADEKKVVENSLVHQPSSVIDKAVTLNYGRSDDDDDDDINDILEK